MNYNTLITAEQLQALMGSGAPLMVFDCSFELMNPAAGRRLFLRTRSAACNRSG